MAPHSATSILILLITIFISSSPTFITRARAQGRAPHGLAYEGPVAFSPSAVEFFHPNNNNNQQLPAVTSGHPEAAQLAAAAKTSTTSTPDEQSKVASSRSGQSGGRSGLGAGAIAGIVFGVGFSVFMAMGAFYVVRARRANLSKASNSVQPQV
ncbi:unnamed protein product [Linum tenue]|uniref:Transmembrane protein n=1 Tax=Linum tenue TaxID=586396 RepID=A0AAV0N364_9ROSI|nr:unnamed protein product [Linum tenue]